MALVTGQPIILPVAAASTGFKAGTQASSNYTWRDLHMVMFPDPNGATSPTPDVVFRGGVRGFSYGAGNRMSFYGHIPHDWVLGTDIYLHLHWSMNGTAISGSLVADYAITYAKGHYQSTYGVPITPTQTIATASTATHPQYGHFLDEFQLSAASPTATQLDTDDIEVDGLIKATLTTTTIPTITAGSLFVDFLDIHYLSHGMGTIAKVPGFYTP
jgi:hypothetical protein